MGGAGGRTRTDMRSEPRQILSLVRIPISPLRLERDAHHKAVSNVAQPCLPLPRFNHTLRQNAFFPTLDHHLTLAASVFTYRVKTCLPHTAETARMPEPGFGGV